MSVRDRLLEPCGTYQTVDDSVTVDLNMFLTRVLLFDVYIVQSFRLKELPVIYDCLGYDTLLDLLSSKRLLFHPLRLYSGILERTGTGLAEHEMRYRSGLVASDPPPTRAGFYEITNLKIIPDPDDEFHEYLQVVASLNGLKPKHRIKLKSALAESLIRLPPTYSYQSTEQTHTDIDRDPHSVALLVAHLLSRQFGTHVQPTQVSLNVHREGEIALFVESNLASEFGIDRLEAHRLVGNALLALARLNVRLENMELCRAVSGTREDEFDFMDHKFNFLAREVRPEDQERRFQRIVEIAGLPDIAHALETAQIDPEAFNKVCQSKECAEFRQWLRNVDDVDETELSDRIRSLRARLGNASHSRSGNVLRMAATSGVGFIPIVGPIAGIAAGALDKFVFDNLLPEAGPIEFLTHLYPSIFEELPGLSS